MLTRLAEALDKKELTEAQLRTFQLFDSAAGTEIDWDDVVSLRHLIEERRLEWLETEFANWTEAMGSVPDTRVLAAPQY